MSNIVAFYRINGTYWYDLSTDGDLDSNKIYDLGIDTLPALEGSYSSNELLGLLGVKDDLFNLVIDARYYVWSENKRISFQLLPRCSFFQSHTSHTRLINEHRLLVTSLYNSFKLKSKNLLVSSSLFSNETKINDVINSFSKFSFSSDYSLWLYNPHTEHFNLYCSSFCSEFQRFKKSDKNHSFGEVLDSEEGFIARDIESGGINSKILSDNKFVNRILITVMESSSRDSITGVLSFYSQHKNLVLQKKIISMIKEMVGLKITKLFSNDFASFTNTANAITTSYDLGNLKTCLDVFSKHAVEVLKYQAASVWLVNNRTKRLEISSLKDSSNRKLEEVEPYELNETSMTGQAVCNNSISFSYNIEEDRRNSSKFNERVAHEPKNWIAVPITSEFDKKGRSVGVLRVKNKTSLIDGNVKVTDFNKLDIDFLKEISTILFHLVNLENSYFSQKNANEKEMEKANDFIKQFRHELRSPLTSLTMASEDIREVLFKERLIKSEQDKDVPKKLRELLTDLAGIGNRLGFVTNYLTIDAEALIEERKVHQTFFDIVAPVTQFAELYARKRKKKLEVDKHNLMALPDSFGDANANAMVFNIVIDNAIKYARRGTSVKVYTQNVYKDRKPKIIVENTGVYIEESEKNDIFKKYHRGKLALEKRIEGSGIGLFLAKKIIELNGGEIELTNTSNPVRFEITFEKAK